MFRVRTSIVSCARACVSCVPTSIVSRVRACVSCANEHSTVCQSRACVLCVPTSMVSRVRACVSCAKEHSIACHCQVLRPSTWKQGCLQELGMLGWALEAICGRALGCQTSQGVPLLSPSSLRLLCCHCVCLQDKSWVDNA